MGCAITTPGCMAIPGCMAMPGCAITIPGCICCAYIVEKKKVKLGVKE